MEVILLTLVSFIVFTSFHPICSFDLISLFLLPDDDPEGMLENENLCEEPRREEKQGHREHRVIIGNNGGTRQSQRSACLRCPGAMPEDTTSRRVPFQAKRGTGHVDRFDMSCDLYCRRHDSRGNGLAGWDHRCWGVRIVTDSMNDHDKKLGFHPAPK
jgi:hypothetical protein